MEVCCREKRQSKMKRLVAFRDRLIETKDGVENVADIVENILVSLGAGRYTNFIREEIAEFFKELHKEHGFWASELRG
jgi:hypothetical protein